MFICQTGDPRIKARSASGGLLLAARACGAKVARTATREVVRATEFAHLCSTIYIPFRLHLDDLLCMHAHWHQARRCITIYLAFCQAPTGPCIPFCIPFGGT